MVRGWLQGEDRLGERFGVCGPDAGVCGDGSAGRLLSDRWSVGVIDDDVRGEGNPDRLLSDRSSVGVLDDGHRGLPVAAAAALGAMTSSLVRRAHAA